MLTRQGANEVRIDRGVRWGACPHQRPGPKFSLLLVINKEANQDVRETQDEERSQNTKGADPVAALPPVHPNIPGFNLPNKPPPPPAAASWADGDDLLAENSQGGSGINGLQPDHSSPDLISALAPHLSLLFGR